MRNEDIDLDVWEQEDLKNAKAQQDRLDNLRENGNIAYVFEYDPRRLDYAIEYFEDITSYLLEEKHLDFSMDGKRDLITIREYGRQPVVYEKSIESAPFGRLYAVDHPIQRLNRVFRTFIIGENYVDVDMCQAHLNIYLSLCKDIHSDIGLETKEMEYFINEYENKPQFKDFWRNILFNGDNLGFVQVQNEVQYNVERLIANYPELYEYVSKSKNTNKKGSFLSFILQEWENKLLMYSVNWLQKRGKIIHSLFYDGFYILNDYTIDEMLPLLQKDIYKDINFRIKFIVKEHINHIPFPNPGSFKKFIVPDYIIREDNYVDYKDMLFDNRVILINAFLGRGKSTALQEFIRNSVSRKKVYFNPSAEMIVNYEKNTGRPYPQDEYGYYLDKPHKTYERVIVLTSRITYAQSVREAFDKSPYGPFTFYKKSKSEKSSNRIETNVIVQVESLYRVSILDDGQLANTLVVIDESESVLCQMTSEDTHKDYHNSNIDCFHRLVSHAGKIIFMDAFLLKANKTLVFCNTMRFNYQVFNYIKKADKRYIQFMMTPTHLIATLLQKLQDGKKIFFFTASKDFLKKVLGIVRTRMPNLIVAAYDSDFKGIYKGQEEPIKSSLANVNKDWANVNMVITTPVISIGISYDDLDNAPQFDCGFVYVSQRAKNKIRDIFQALYRVRKFKDNKIYACLTANDKTKLEANQNTSTEFFIRKALRKKILHLKEYYMSRFYMRMYQPMEMDWLYELKIQNDLEDKQSIYQMKGLFLDYCEISNYEVVNEESLDFLEEAFEEIKAELKFDHKGNYNTLNYTDIPTLDLGQFRALFNVDNRSPMERGAMCKFRLALRYDISNDTEATKQHIFNMYCSNPDIFDHIKRERVYNWNQTLMNIEDVYLPQDKAIAPKIIKKVLDALNLENTYTSGVKVNVENFMNIFDSKEKCMGLLDELKVEKPKSFSMTQRASVALVKSILKDYSVSKIESTQRKVGKKGKRTSVQEYTLQKRNVFRFFNIEKLK